jgi:threonine dehydrogenase-like Zn-dependent dehydrogenase
MVKATLVRHGGVIPFGGISKGGFLVRFQMVLTTGALMLGAYSPYQKELFDRVLWMRETKGLTFKGIADALVAEGYKAPRGGLLGAESVFSIYKKGAGRVKRLNASPRLEIRAVEVLTF